MLIGVQVLPQHWQPTRAERIHTSAPDATPSLAAHRRAKLAQAEVVAAADRLIKDIKDAATWAENEYPLSNGYLRI